ncbi:hypothetical protein ACTNEF_09670, partial [Bariatricus sp. HCP28S3_E4]|uniref:hypothetical protein n=1 Tax=unclassified Bariatricus TaxID=2677046 RepID=UPI003F88B279
HCNKIQYNKTKKLTQKNRFYAACKYFSYCLTVKLPGTEAKVMFHEKEITLNRLKLARRDGIGTKMRK